MKDLQEQIESENTVEELVDNVMEKDTLFPKLPESRIPIYFSGLSGQLDEVYSETSNIKLTDPSLFDERVVSVNYGKKNDGSYFVGVQTSRGTVHEIGNPLTLDEAEKKAQILFNSSEINLTDLESKEMRNG